ncbi:MAG: ExbD/TolR family protein [Chthoniobacterales bacterium]
MKIDTLLADFSEEAEFQMAPMIDITFLLIIFFMVAANVNVSERIDIKVPVAEASRASKDPSNRLNLSITEDGKLYLGSTLVEKDFLQQQATTLFKENPNLKIFLRADARVKHKAVKEALSVLAEAGITDIIFATYETPN